MCWFADRARFDSAEDAGILEADDPDA